MTVDHSVTLPEAAEYAAFGHKAISEYMKPFPDVLWYYTSGSTFAEIIKRKQIWSTQISCLNDTTEFRRSVKLLRDAFIPYLEDTKCSADTRWLANYLYKDLIQDGADTSFFFVMCMSKKRDDLSQWRAYGDGEGGVAIGLMPDKTKIPTFDIDAANVTYLVPVSYDKTEHEQLAAKIAAVVLHYFCDGLGRRKGCSRETWAQIFLTAFRDSVIYLAPILKDPSFRDEDEWRLVCTLHEHDKGKIEIQQRQTLISRHLPLTFHGALLPIREVVVGPCRHPSVSRVSVATFLEARGYRINQKDENDPTKVTVSDSAIPFQMM